MARAPRRRFRTGRDDRGAQGQVKLGEERGSVKGMSKKHGAQSIERRGTPSEGRKGLNYHPARTACPTSRLCVARGRILPRSDGTWPMPEVTFAHWAESI